MKKILFTMLLFIGATAVQAAIVNDSTGVATPTDSTKVDPIEAAYNDLKQSIDRAYKKSAALDKNQTLESLNAAADEIKKIVVDSNDKPAEEEKYVPDPKVEAKKTEYQKICEEYEDFREDAEWLDEANAYFVKLVQDCIDNPKPTELQIKRAREAAENLPPEEKRLKKRFETKFKVSQ